MKLFIFALLAVTVHQSFAGSIPDLVEVLDLKEYDIQQDIPQEIDSLLPFSCECDNITQCMCCGKLEVPRLDISRQSCVRLSYNGDKAALTVTFIVNEKVVFSKTVSANNPPPLCFSWPPGNFIADLCFRFYDVQAKLSKLHTCVDINPRILLKKIMTIRVGCFKFGGDKEEFYQIEEGI